MYKKVITLFFLVMILNFIIFNVVECEESSEGDNPTQKKVGQGFDYEQIPQSGNPMNEDLKKPFRNIWATTKLVFQILSVAGVAFAGVKYMFASADQKADIKKGLIYVVIGCVIVFCATTVIDYVVNVFKQIT